jgi:hypothetical protein
VLGGAINEAFEPVLQAGIEIQVAASTLRDIVIGGTAAMSNNQSTIRQCQSVIWEAKDDDPIQPLSNAP